MTVLSLYRTATVAPGYAVQNIDSPHTRYFIITHRDGRSQSTHNETPSASSLQSPTFLIRHNNQLKLHGETSFDCNSMASSLHTISWRFCDICKLFKPPRSHHCSKCKRFILYKQLVSHVITNQLMMKMCVEERSSLSVGGRMYRRVQL